MFKNSKKNIIVLFGKNRKDSLPIGVEEIERKFKNLKKEDGRR